MSEPIIDTVRMVIEGMEDEQPQLPGSSWNHVLKNVLTFKFEGNRLKLIEQTNDTVPTVFAISTVYTNTTEASQECRTLYGKSITHGKLDWDEDEDGNEVAYFKNMTNAVQQAKHGLKRV